MNDSARKIGVGVVLGHSAGVGKYKISMVAKSRRLDSMP